MGSLTTAAASGVYHCEITSVYMTGRDGALISPSDTNDAESMPFLAEDIGTTFRVFSATGTIDTGPFETLPWFDRQVLNPGRPYEPFKMVLRDDDDVYVVRIEPGYQGSGRRFIGLHEGGQVYSGKCS